MKKGREMGKRLFLVSSLGEGKRKDCISSTQILLDPKVGSVLERRQNELLDLR